MAAPGPGPHNLPVPRPPLNAFTIDVEDYFQVSGFEGAIPREAWASVPPRIAGGLSALLDLLEAHSVQATFFTLGWVARQHPQLLRAIVERGHEVGCHSHEHRLVYEQTPAEFRADTRLALDEIQQASGQACTLYRAPTFSITRRSLWALPILAEEGIRLDSSVYPVVHDRYGIPGAPRFPYRPLPDVPDFVEFPPSTFRLLGLTLPCAGGGYLRIFPTFLTRYAVRSITQGDAQPAVLYVHPWELDPGQPALPGGTLQRLRHRVNLDAMGTRLAELLSRFRFSTMSAALEALGGAAALPFRDPARR